MNTVPLTSACALMIYSVLSIRSDIKKHQTSLQDNFFAKERLMQIHTLIFAVGIVFIIAENISNYYYDHFYEENKFVQMCRDIKVQSCLRACKSIIFVAIIVLFSYMSA